MVREILRVFPSYLYCHVEKAIIQRPFSPTGGQSLCTSIFHTLSSVHLIKELRG
jgi:hypothetical protein